MSFLLTNTTAATAITAGGSVPVGSPVHGCGNNIKISGDNISVTGAGYYNILVSASFLITGATAAEMSLLIDGTAVASAVATPAAAGDAVTLVVPWVLRKSCSCSQSIISLSLSQAATVESVTVEVIKQ